MITSYKGSESIEQASTFIGTHLLPFQALIGCLGTGNSLLDIFYGTLGDSGKELIRRWIVYRNDLALTRGDKLTIDDHFCYKRTHQRGDINHIFCSLQETRSFR